MTTYVYALQSIQKTYIYVGLTQNVQERFKRHQNGREKTTRSYRPFRIIFTEEYATREEARIREKYLKSGYGKEWIKARRAGVVELADTHGSGPCVRKNVRVQIPPPAYTIKH